MRHLQLVSDNIMHLSHIESAYIAEAERLVKHHLPTTSFKKHIRLDSDESSTWISCFFSADLTTSEILKINRKLVKTLSDSDLFTKLNRSIGIIVIPT